MKLIQIKITYNGWPDTYEWVPESNLAETLEQISLCGLGAEII